MRVPVAEIAEKFLRITYEITYDEPSNLVTLQQVAERFTPDEIGTTESEYMNELSKIAMYLGRKGSLDRQSSDWGLFSITPEGIDEVEGTNKPAAGSTFNFYAPVHGSVVGTHNKAELTNVFNFGEFDRAIEEFGGEDKVELRELAEQLRQLIEEKDTINRGVWARFAALMQKHPWVIDFIGKATAGWLTQQTSLPPNS